MIRHQWNNHCLYKHELSHLEVYISRWYRHVSTLSVCNIHRNCGNWIISHRSVLADGTAKTKLKLSSIAESKYRCTYWRLWKGLLLLQGICNGICNGGTSVSCSTTNMKWSTMFCHLLSPENQHSRCWFHMCMFYFRHYTHKNIDIQRIPLFHDLSPKQWVIVHTSDLMMVIRQSMYILSIITKEMCKLKTHSPTYCIMDNWENMLNLTHSLDKLYLTGKL